MHTKGGGSAVQTGDACRAWRDAGALRPPLGGFGFPVSMYR